MNSRQTELLNNCFGYLSELISDEKELKRVLTKTIGLTKQELADYGFCFMSPDLNPMCLGCTRIDTDCEGSTNSVWTGCIFRKTKGEVDYALKFKQLLELSENLKTGAFGDTLTQFSERGFRLYSQCASITVQFIPETQEWGVKGEYDDGSEEYEEVRLGTGWKSLIQYLCVEQDMTWFINLSKEQIELIMEER